MKSIILLSLIMASSGSANRDQNLDFWIRQLRNPLVDIQINALEKLAEIKDPPAVREMTRNLNSENSEVRFQAAQSLTKIPTAESLEALGERSRIEKDVYVKAEINRSIRRLKDFFESAESDKKKKTESETAQPDNLE